MAKITKKIVESLREHKKDSGSAAYQIGLLTHKIEDLIGHLKKNPKDKHSRKGLLGMVSQRKKLLKYLQANKTELYEKVTKKLGLKK